jgi:lipopolysaccharide transport system ATP-binding protein
MSTVISVEHLSKAYRLGQIGTGTLTYDMKLWWAKVRGKPNPLLKIGEQDHGNRDGETIWALKDVSFKVEQGEVLGIIGRNGAGKSTLLKILSRVTAPTSGRITGTGRVASLLEVGTGFHPELTGRENIYLNGAILGMSRKEIDRKFDEIVAFSEIEKFIDTPVKRYSSGMYVRLAFAVAAHLDPEILIVDEVLAVGDAEFQKKCLGKMSDVAKEGRTVLFVSHNMSAIQNLCTNCIWINKGTIHQMGESTEVINSYLEKAFEQGFQGEVKLADWPNRYGKGGVRIVSARLLDANNNITTRVFRTQPMSFEFDFESDSPHALLLSSVIAAESGEWILHLSQYDTSGLKPRVLSGKYRGRFSIPSLPLNEGNYNFFIGIHTENSIPLDVVRDVLPFEVHDIKDSPRPFKTVTKLAFCWTPNQCAISQLH